MIQEKVTTILAEVLGIEEPGKITMNSHIIDDLAAESIDLVDICFRLEQDFQLGKVNPGDIFPAFMREEGALDPSGEIPAPALSRLAQEYPYMEKEVKEEFIRTKDANVFFKVKSLVYFVEHRMTH